MIANYRIGGSSQGASSESAERRANEKGQAAIEAFARHCCRNSIRRQWNDVLAHWLLAILVMLLVIAAAHFQRQRRRLRHLCGSGRVVDGPAAGSFAWLALSKQPLGWTLIDTLATAYLAWTALSTLAVHGVGDMRGAINGFFQTAAIRAGDVARSQAGRHEQQTSRPGLRFSLRWPWPSRCWDWCSIL